MSDEREAIERLERRVEQLEALVRKLVSVGQVPDSTIRAPRAEVEPAR